MKIKRVQVRGSLFHFLSTFVQKQVSEYLHMCSRSFSFTDFDIIYHPLLSYLFCFFEPSSFFFPPSPIFFCSSPLIVPFALSLSALLCHSFVVRLETLLHIYLSIYLHMYKHIYILERDSRFPVPLSLTHLLSPLSTFLI